MKGTPSRGKHGKGRIHIRCARCGRPAFHIRKKKCSSCGYGKSRRLRKYSWQKKTRSKWSYRIK